MAPLVSILIANYNNSKFFDDLFSSILKQTYENWEVIFVDDCSTDDSQEEIKKYLIDHRIKVFSNEKNLGAGYTKKKAIDEAKGDILMFLDPDDTITIDAIKEMVIVHQQYPMASLVYSNLQYCDEKLNFISIETRAHEFKIGENNLIMDKVSALASFKNYYYKMTIGIDKDLRAAVDKDLYFKLEEVGDIKFVDKILYYYRQHSMGISQNKNNVYSKLCYLKILKASYQRRKLSNKKRITYTEYLTRKSAIYLSIAISVQKYSSSFTDYLIYLIKAFITAPWYIAIIFLKSILKKYNPSTEIFHSNYL